MTPHPAALLFPLMDGVAVTALADDIRARGLLEPITTLDGTVLDGRNRLAACEQAGVEPRFVAWDGAGGSPTAWVLAKNLKRRHLTPSQAAMVGADALPLFAAEARERQRRHGGTAPGRTANTVRNGAQSVPTPGEETGARKACETVRTPCEPPAEDDPAAPPTTPRAAPAPKAPHRASDDAAATVGVSGRSVETARKVQKAAPDLAAAVRTGSLPLARAAREVRRREADRKAAAAPAAPEMPDVDLRLDDAAVVARTVHGAALVHADPPWPYRNQRLANTTDNHYENLELPAILDAIDAAYDAANDDTYLLLWTTFPMLAEWFAASRELRWRYLSGGAWAKTGRLGIGFHWRGDAEVLLLYARGRPTPRETVSSLYISERGEHSEKPEAWLRALVRAFAPEGGLVLDLFAGLAPMARACRAEGRRYVGAETNATRRAEALRTLAALVP